MNIKKAGAVALLFVGCALIYNAVAGHGHDHGHGHDSHDHSQKAFATPAAGAAVDPATVHSGEGIITGDGRFIRLPDPTKEEGQVIEAGWQKSLAASMTQAIRAGQEQVVLVFSRADSASERQKPVLERAIQKRAIDMLRAESAATPAATAFIGGLKAPPTGILASPLRVFFLDAGEFPKLTQQLKIEAFPTTMVFGAPGSAPLVAQGFMNDFTVDRVLKKAALPSGERKQALGMF